MAWFGWQRTCKDSGPCHEGNSTSSLYRKFEIRIRSVGNWSSKDSSSEICSLERVILQYAWDMELIVLVLLSSLVPQNLGLSGSDIWSKSSFPLRRGRTGLGCYWIDCRIHHCLPWSLRHLWFLEIQYLVCSDTPRPQSIQRFLPRSLEFGKRTEGYRACGQGL